jgi:hypothetical protein
MRKKLLTVLSVLLIAALTIQMATAAGRNARKAARSPVPVTHQLRDALGSVDWPSTAQSDYSYYSKRHGLSTPVAIDNKVCDIISCYDN